MSREVRCPNCGRIEGLRTFFSCQTECIIRGEIDNDGIIDILRQLNLGDVAGDVFATFISDEKDIQLTIIEAEVGALDVYCPSCTTIFSLPKGAKAKCRILD